MSIALLPQGKRSGSHHLRLERIRALDDRIAFLKDRLWWTGEAARDLERELLAVIRKRDGIVEQGHMVTTGKNR